MQPASGPCGLRAGSSSMLPDRTPGISSRVGQPLSCAHAWRSAGIDGCADRLNRHPVRSGSRRGAGGNPATNRRGRSGLDPRIRRQPMSSSSPTQRAVSRSPWTAPAMSASQSRSRLQLLRSDRLGHSQAAGELTCPGSVPQPGQACLARTSREDTHRVSCREYRLDRGRQLSGVARCATQRPSSKVPDSLPRTI